jgi:hypothetical protein
MMPLHRRHNASSNDDSSLSPKVKSSSPAALENPRTNIHASHSTTTTASKIRTLQILVLSQAALLVLVVSRSDIKSKIHLLSLVATLVMASLPVFAILAVGLGVFDNPSSDLAHQRYIPLVVVATIVGNQLPTVLGSGMAAAGMLVFGLSSRPKPVSEPARSKTSSKSKAGLSGPLKAVLAVILMTAVLLTENFFIWVVSATYKPRQWSTHTAPLAQQRPKLDKTRHRQTSKFDQCRVDFGFWVRHVTCVD